MTAKSWIGNHPRAGLFLIALVSRLAWSVATRSSVPVEDAVWYWSAARTLFSEHAYADGGRLTAYWPVGYPFFLSLFMPFGEWSRPLVQVAQALLSSFTVVCVHDLARKAGAGRTAWLAAAAFALFPSSISLSSLLLSETLFTFTMVLAVWSALCVDGRKGPWISALALSLACYVRPVGILLIPLLYGGELSRGRKVPYLGKTALVAAVVLLTAAPWAVRNYRVFGGFAAYSTNLGVNLYMGHNPEATGGYVETPEMDAIAREYPNELQRSRRFQELALSHIRDRPLATAILSVKKVFRLLVTERTPVYYSFITQEGGTYPAWSRFLAAFNNLYYLIFLGLFLASDWWRCFRARPERFWLGVVFWIQILFYCTFVIADRYKFPGIPLLLAVSASPGYWFLRPSRPGPVPAEARPGLSP